MDGDWAVWARGVPAVAVLPLGGVAPRLVLAAGCAAVLSEWVEPPPTTATTLVAEAALGATLGLLAGMPVHAAEALRGDGPEALGFAARVLAWAVFFGAGGPGLLLLALGRSFSALPAAAWPGVEAVVAAGGALLHAALLLGLPAWLTGLIAAPIAGLCDRVAPGAFGAQAASALRPAVAVLLLAAFLPVFLDQLRGYWLAALVGS